MPLPLRLPAAAAAVKPEEPTSGGPIIDVVVADDDDDDDDRADDHHDVRREYKMVRLARDASQRCELGIIIAKKKLRDVPTTGFKVVHIEPDGIVDR